MSNNKMKGLLKGLRYISQIFDNEKEPEMQIGFPTDVKHVAHIGWDGPSVNTPTWMNEFKGAPGEVNEDASAQWGSQDSKRDMAVTQSTARDMPELPKASRRQSSTVGGGVAESPTREKSEKPKTRKSSKSKESSSENTRPSRRNSDLNHGGESPTQAAPGVPKKTRRKKSKDSAVDTCKAEATDTCSSQYSDNGSDHGSVAGSISRSNDDDLLTGDGVFA